MNAALAFLLAACISAVSAVAFAMVCGHLNTPISLVSLSLGALGAALWMFIRPARIVSARLGIVDWLLALMFALFSLRAFCWLIFFKNDDLCVLSPNNLGDMSLHLTYIRYFARGASFWPENPIFSGTQLHYPLGIDVFNALLTLVGVDVYRGLIWVGLAGCFATCVMLYRWGGWFAIAGFLFNGGLAGFAFFKTGRFLDYQAELGWKSIPLAMFVTQRGLLYAIPAGLALLTSWRARWFSPEQDSAPARLPRWLEVVFYSTMPLFHLHTFLFLSGLLGWWLAVAGSKKTRVEILQLLALSVCQATLLVSLVTGLFQKSAEPVAHFIHWKAGWMQGHQGFLAFWGQNFGLLPLFVIAMLARIIRLDRGNAEARTAAAFVVPSLLVFLVACFVMFAPWEWDNTKLMIWCYLAILPFLWELVIRPLPKPVAVSSCVVLFFSGFVSLWGGLSRAHAGYPIAQRSELDAVRHAVAGIAADDTFAAMPAYNHPLLLSGCKLAEGYPGHLRSHGIPYRKRDAQLRRLMLGEADWRDIARQLHIRYIFWGRLELSGADAEPSYRSSLTPWRDDDDLAAEGSWGELYRLRD